MSDELKRENSESVTDYEIRLFSNKQLYNLTSEEIAQLLNKELGESNGESKYRKDFAAFKRWKEYLINKNLDQEIVDKYETIKLEAEKEKIRKQDQKREYKKLVRNSARFEQLQDEIISAVSKLAKEKTLSISPPLPSYTDFSVDREGLALFSDWHFGADVNNSLNIFNKQVFNKRVSYLVEKIIEYGKANHISTLNIGALGDFVHGLIHVSARVQSNEDLIQQITYVSEVLSDVFVKLASVFPNIKVYFVNGNHARPGKAEDFGMNENFELLLPWYVKARLQNIDNINIVTERDGYILTSIFDKKIIFVHGQYDNADVAVNKLPQMLGTMVDYIMGGHVHHVYEREFSTTTTLVNGSLIGADDYSVQKRFGTKPSQKFMVFDKEIGLESTYDIKLNIN
jgi:UDP-2,3-diacylglucosamine pyrophosphatase LpxH